MKDDWQVLDDYRRRLGSNLKPKEKVALDAAVDLLMDQSIAELFGDSRQIPEEPCGEPINWPLACLAILVLPFILVRWALACLDVWPLPPQTPGADAQKAHEEATAQRNVVIPKSTLDALGWLYVRTERSMTGRERRAIEAALEIMKTKVSRSVNV